MKVYRFDLIISYGSGVVLIGAPDEKKAKKLLKKYVKDDHRNYDDPYQLNSLTSNKEGVLLDHFYAE